MGILVRLWLWRAEWLIFDYFLHTMPLSLWVEAGGAGESADSQCSKVNCDCVSSHGHASRLLGTGVLQKPLTHREEGFLNYYRT